MGTFKTHPIQIASIHVGKLYINVNNPMAFEDDAESYSNNFDLEVAVSDFDDVDRLIHVRLRAKIGIINGEGSDEFIDDKESPINLMVELRGALEVNTEAFPMDKLEHFSMYNAPLLIYPYLREHVMGLTTRAGLRGLILPLFEVPPFKLQK
ncbi:protein-export chaperone SecB [Morganella morganii]